MRVLVFCLVMGMVQGQGGGGFMQLMQMIGGGAPEIFPEDSKVLALEAPAFLAKQEANEHMFVMFYAPWCHYCREMMPAWEEVAIKLQGQIAIGRMDCDAPANHQFCQSNGINGFPSLKLYKGKTETGQDDVSEYNGRRTAKSLLNFLALRHEYTEYSLPPVLHAHAHRGQAEVARLLLALVGRGYADHAYGHMTPKEAAEETVSVHIDGKTEEGFQCRKDSYCNVLKLLWGPFVEKDHNVGHYTYYGENDGRPCYRDKAGYYLFWSKSNELWIVNTELGNAGQGNFLSRADVQAPDDVTSGFQYAVDGAWTADPRLRFLCQVCAGAEFDANFFEEVTENPLVPHAQLPILVWGHMHLVGVNAISRYIGLKNGLLGEAGQEALVDMLTEWAWLGMEFYEDFVYSRSDHKDAAAFVSVEAEPWLDALSKHAVHANVKGWDFLTGNKPTIADVALFNTVSLLLGLDPDCLHAVPLIGEWWVEVGLRPGIYEYLSSKRRMEWPNSDGALWGNAAHPDHEASNPFRSSEGNGDVDDEFVDIE